MIIEATRYTCSYCSCMIIKSLISASSPRADGGLCQHHGIWLGNHQRGNHSLRTPPRETTQPLFFYARWVRKVSEFPCRKIHWKVFVIWISMPDNSLLYRKIPVYDSWFFTEMLIPEIFLFIILLILGKFLSMILFKNFDPRNIPVNDTVQKYWASKYSCPVVFTYGILCLWSLGQFSYSMLIFLPVKFLVERTLSEYSCL